MARPPAVAPPIPAMVRPVVRIDRARPRRRRGQPPTPAAPTPAPTTGKIAITSTPAKASVMVNGKWRGRTPLRLDAMKFGSYNLRVVLPGFATAHEDVALSAAEPSRTVAVRLQKNTPPAGGRCRSRCCGTTCRDRGGANGQPGGICRVGVRRFQAARGTYPDRRPDDGDDPRTRARRLDRVSRRPARTHGPSSVDGKHPGCSRGGDPRDRLSRTASMKATLALENGLWYKGEAAGAPGETGGEVVFNTSMTGYQEVLTDPSYAGQIVTMTCPRSATTASRPRTASRARRRSPASSSATESPMASNWRSDSTLRDYLVRNNIVAISDIDTRALTRVLRSAGVMRGIIATGDVDPRALVEQARDLAPMEGSDLVRRRDVRGSRSTGRRRRPVGRVRARRRSAAPNRPLRIAAYDFGMKWNILRRFTAYGCDVRVFPATAPASELLAIEPGRRVPQQRPRRSRGARLRGRERDGARRRRTFPSSASASGTRSCRSRSAARPTS